MFRRYMTRRVKRFVIFLFVNFNHIWSDHIKYHLIFSVPIFCFLGVWNSSLKMILYIQDLWLKGLYFTSYFVLQKVGKAMSSNESAAYEIMRALDVNYVLVIFGGVIGYSGDDINKFLWMVRIAEGEHPKDIKVRL